VLWRGFIYSKAQENLRAQPPNPSPSPKKTGGRGALITEVDGFLFLRGRLSLPARQRRAPPQHGPGPRGLHAHTVSSTHSWCDLLKSRLK
jgi:hypothetical protein